MRWEIGNGSWFLADCFDALTTIPDGSVDMILCDLPYGTTQNKWDSVLPLDRLWSEYWRVCKSNAAIVLTAQPPFDKMLGASCLPSLRYEWIWEKSIATGHLNANRAPLKAHENILVFYKLPPPYFPQKTTGHPDKGMKRHGKASSNYGTQRPTEYRSTERYPRSVQPFQPEPRGSGFHPTQKPVALFEYMLKTYTRPGDLVLDNCAGSGTTAIAAENTGRRWICMEKDETYSVLALDRIARHLETERAA